MDGAEFTRRVIKAERKLYRIAYSILWNDQDCCDAAQETMAKAWQYKDKLYSEAYFDTWLVRILINECRSMLRKRKRDVSEPDEDMPEPSRDRERDIDLADALIKLPEKYRLPTLLHYLEGYSLNEIARILRLPEARVKSRLHQARGKLRDLLGGEDYEA